MAGADNILFNNLERALSSDVNDLQSMGARVLADLLRHMMQQRRVLSGALPTNSDRDVVLGGLIASPNASSVDVSRGALLQASASIAPVPGALDSDYRIAMNRVVETLVAPSPGADTYYLLEAQMENVVTLNTVRDIFDPGSGTFVPTAVDKRQERQLTFRFRAGTATAAPAAVVNWVPIAIVFRLSGGGAVAAADIQDVRPLWQRNIIEASSSPSGGVVTAREFRSGSVFGTYVNTAEFDFDARLDGEHLFARSSALVDLSVAALQDPSNPAFTTVAIWYVYLGEGRPGLFPANLYTGMAHRGVVVVSRIAPSLRQLNSAPITLPEPFDGVSIATGRAVCVGAFLTRAAGLEMQSCDRGGHHSLTFNGKVLVGAVLNSGSPTNAIDFDTELGGLEAIPYNAHLAYCKARTAIRDGGASDAVIETENTGGAPAGFYDRAGLDPTLTHDNSEIVIPASLERQYRFTVTTVGGIGTADFQIDLRGWSY